MANLNYGIKMKGNPFFDKTPKKTVHGKALDQIALFSLGQVSQQEIQQRILREGVAKRGDGSYKLGTGIANRINIRRHGIGNMKATVAKKDKNLIQKAVQ